MSSPEPCSGLRGAPVLQGFLISTILPGQNVRARSLKSGGIFLLRFAFAPFDMQFRE